MITNMNKEDILLLTDKGLAVFKHYIPFPFKLGRNFLNPLYKDSKASCNVYFDRRSGIYKMKDFGNDDYSGDCFALVGKLNGLNCKEPKDFVEILAIIDRDMHLGLSERFDMRALSSKPVLVILEVVHEPLFGYTAKQYVKVYRPRSELRFMYAGDFGENYCFGLEQLAAKGDLLFVTGGEKDVMSLAAHGFHAICFNSETVTVPVGIIHRLSFRFKHIVLLYNVDKTGLDGSAKRELALKNYGVKRLLLPLAGIKEKKCLGLFPFGKQPGGFD